MNPSSVRSVVFVSALYDLLVTWPFALPWSARALSSVMGRLHDDWRLTGARPSLDDPTTLLFATLMGSIVTVWSLVRLLRPTPWLGAADTFGRLLFSFSMLFSLLHGGSSLVLGFLVPEALWGLVQGAVVLPALWARRDAQA